MAEATKTAPALGVVRIAGRIAGTRRKSVQGGTLFFTLLKLPAPDAYSSPATVEVRSPERVGAIGDEVSLVCSIGGYGRSYDQKDDDGQKITVQTAENTLQVLAHA